jgi:hypothetical protein
VRYDNLARINVSTSVTICQKYIVTPKLWIAVCAVYFTPLNVCPSEVWHIDDLWRNSEQSPTQWSKYHGTKCHLQNFSPTRPVKTKDIHPINSHRMSSAQENTVQSESLFST